MVAETLLCIKKTLGVSIPNIEASSLLEDLQSDF